MTQESRDEYRCISDGTEAFFSCERPAPQEQRYLMAVADNVSLGGLFLGCRNPPPPGTVVRLHLFDNTAGEAQEPLGARAIVRWRRQWGKGRGMGLQFLEFEGLHGRRLGSWLESLLEQNGRAPSALPLAAVA